MSISLAGCAPEVTEERITLERALQDTVDAMYAAHKRSVEDAKALHYSKGLGIRLVK